MIDKILYKLKKIIPAKLFKKLQPAYHFIFSFISAAAYRWPSRKLIVIGITGTTGKTSSVFLVASALKNAGYKVGYTSTAMFGDGNREWLNDKKMTMVGRFFTQRMLREMVKNGCQYAIVETTSEGIRQFRHRFINYDVIIFTGLYPEHIESHGSFENYRAAKGRLFKHLRSCRIKYVNDAKQVCYPKDKLDKTNYLHVKKTIIANGDDEQLGYFMDFWAESKIVYSLNPKCSEGKNWDLVTYLPKQSGANGSEFSINVPYSLLCPGDRQKFSNPEKGISLDFSLKILGSFNITNSLNAVAVALSQEFSLETTRQALENIDGLPGRLEAINSGQNFMVIVDYAFEPRALEKLYETVNSLRDPSSKIIHVLGSTGGGRDKSRRAILGKMAAENADYVIVTNEDPYDEDPKVIIEEVALGAEHGKKKNKVNLFKILDRRQAISKALSLAGDGDVVLITGKGSEQAICVKNGEKIPWDDRRVAREELAYLIK